MLAKVQKDVFFKLRIVPAQILINGIQFHKP